VIETERLLLRQCVVEDADVILRLLNEPSFLENVGDRGVRTTEDATTYLLNGPIASYAANGYGIYLVLLKETGAPIGMCGLLQRPQFAHPDVGYAFFPEFWRQGFAIEAASAVVEYTHRTLAINPVLALVSPHNARSIQLLEKLGFIFQEPALLQPANSEVLVFTHIEVDS
jgi:[ribosomal protein S5]-alanine N-acetyltransferase